MAASLLLFLLTSASEVTSVASRCLVPVELCNGPLQSKRCNGHNSPRQLHDGSLFNIPLGGSATIPSNTSRILRGFRLTDFRGGSSNVMTASRFQALRLLSGGVAGSIASCVTNPLEIVKTQLQSSSAAVGELSKAGGHPIAITKAIFEKDGVLGFFKGLRPTLAGIIPARSIYFFSYEQSKHFLGSVGFKEGNVANALLSGLAAGVSSNSLTNPIWMVKSRMQLLADSTANQRVYTGYRDAVKSIFKDEGISGFYKGISASYWGCIEGGAQFVMYEQLKTRLTARQNKQREEQGLEPTDELPKLVYFLSAALAKGTASIMTYPHEVARTRMREQARNGIFKYQGMWQTIGLVAKEEGTKGLYSGMGVHLLKVVPNSAIMFLSYEMVSSYLQKFTVIEE